MIKIENIETCGWDAAIRGMRNPMNSWEKSDSVYAYNDNEKGWYILGPNDFDLAMRLVQNGPVHAKFRRMIVATMDITAPLYWWKEFDTYKVGTVANSCSTIHKIMDKEFTREDFSVEDLVNFGYSRDLEAFTYTKAFGFILDVLNDMRNRYLQLKSQGRREDMDLVWRNLIQFLPSSYNQKRTVLLNYEVLNNIYQNRKDHKLSEWRDFCETIEEQIPYSKLFAT